jgi:hypothetical protein
VITVELVRFIHDGHRCDPEVVARVVADRGDVHVDGPEAELVDREQKVLNLRTGTTITCADDPEEWVRGLTVSYRTPYLSARVVEDTNPLPDVEIARAEVKEPVFR